MLEFLYCDKDIIVCLKPPGVLSTDEPGGMPALIRQQLGSEQEEVHTVHRLDRVVGGLMVFARTQEASAELGRQITDRSFDKLYLAVAHGCPKDAEGRFDDLLFRDTYKGMTYPVKRMRKGVRDAALEYSVLGEAEGLSLNRIHLLTGRTHQIRVQFSSRQMPLVGDKKYGAAGDDCPIALYSAYLSFHHPSNGDKLAFRSFPPETYPWNLFDMERTEL